MTRCNHKPVSFPVGCRAMLSAAAALPLVTVLNGKAAAATFRLKMANVQPGTHPTSVRMKEAAKRIGEKTNGELHSGSSRAVS